MITRRSRIMLALLALMPIAPLQVSGLAFRKAEPQKIRVPTYVDCKFVGGVTTTVPLMTRLAITNSTRSAIKKGTTIHWKATDSNKGSFTLTNDLRPTASVSSVVTLNHLMADSVKPRAWYYK